MSESHPALELEPRWPIVLAILLVFALSFLPGRIRVFPPWAVAVIVAIVVAPMAALHLGQDKRRWLQIERIVIWVFVVIVGGGMVLDLKDLFQKMLNPPTGITGIELLNSSVSLWASNVLTFAVLYWVVDRGGTLARAKRLQGVPDWIFPREATDHEALPPWSPTFVDYLYLAYCTASAFTPAEAMPMTSRAKMMMMVEGLIALVTLLAVASRAIGLLGN